MHYACAAAAAALRRCRRHRRTEGCADHDVDDDDDDCGGVKVNVATRAAYATCVAWRVPAAHSHSRERERVYNSIRLMVISSNPNGHCVLA